jgi:hypothetical protein
MKPGQLRDLLDMVFIPVWNELTDARAENPWLLQAMPDQWRVQVFSSINIISQINENVGPHIGKVKPRITDCCSKFEAKPMNLAIDGMCLILGSVFSGLDQSMQLPLNFESDAWYVYRDVYSKLEELQTATTNVLSESSRKLLGRRNRRMG